MIHLERARISAAVHRVVCDSTGSDGYGHCLGYAVAGSTVLSGLTGRLWLVQVGTLHIRPDPDRAEGLEWNAELGGLDAGEFHAWIVGPIDPGRTRPGLSRVEGDLQLVDFSARHYRRMVESQMLVQDVQRLEDGAILTLDRESVRPCWKRPEQEYLWVRQPPSWIVLRPNKRDTETAMRRLGEFSGLIEAAKRACRELKGRAG